MENGTTIKEAGTIQRLETGRTTAKCNIFDMGGNVVEFTTEVMPSASEPVVLHGGDYNYNGPAGRRRDNGTSFTNSTYGLRATLFLK